MSNNVNWTNWTTHFQKRQPIANKNAKSSSCVTTLATCGKSYKDTLLLGSGIKKTWQISTKIDRLLDREPISFFQYGIALLLKWWEKVVENNRKYFD